MDLDCSVCSVGGDLGGCASVEGGGEVVEMEAL